MAKDEGVQMGRRTALLCKGPADPVDATDDNDPTCQQLLATRRWVEALIPLKDGYGHMLAASAYDFSGASSGGEDYVYNEALAANFITRAAQYPKIPYIIGTDINIDPLDSEVIGLANTSGIIHDLPCDWCPQRVPPTTFLKEGAYEGMTVGTRIDTILTNFVAGHGCVGFAYG